MFDAILDAIVLPFKLAWALMLLLVQVVVALVWLVVIAAAGIGFYYAGLTGAVLAIDVLVLLLAAALVAYGEKLGLAAALALMTVAACWTFLFL